MEAQPLSTVERETGKPVRASVIWLHGLGADGHDFEPIVPELALAGSGLRFVFPHAPVRPVSLNGGLAMRAWYDVFGLDRSSAQDTRGIHDSAVLVRDLILRENERGIPSERIVLAGFSQGGAMALHTGLRHPARLAGILGLSTYLPLHDRLDDEAQEANRATPLFLGHGTLDPLVHITLGLETRDYLRHRGYAVEWRDYPMAHAVCPQEISDVREWLAASIRG